MVSGRLLTDLSRQNWLVLDAFEDDIYTLERVTLADGRTALAYVCRDPDQVDSGSWSADAFAKESLPEYAARCERWREQHDAATAQGAGDSQPSASR